MAKNNNGKYKYSPNYYFSGHVVYSDTIFKIPH